MSRGWCSREGDSLTSKEVVLASAGSCLTPGSLSLGHIDLWCVLTKQDLRQLTFSQVFRCSFSFPEAALTLGGYGHNLSVLKRDWKTEGESNLIYF